MWTETGTAPDQATGGTWHYYRLDGNNFGFIGNRAYSAMISYNKTVLVVDGASVAAETHVTAHIGLTDKNTDDVTHLDVRYYYEGQNVWHGLNAIPDQAIRNYVENSLQTISAY